MKKLSLIFILATLILGVYGCGEEPSEPSAPKDYKSAEKLEPVFEDYDFILDIFQNNYDDNYYAMLCNRNVMQLNIFMSTDLGATWNFKEKVTRDMFDSSMYPFFNTSELFHDYYTIIYSKNNYAFYSILESGKYRKKGDQNKFEKIDAKIYSADSMSVSPYVPTFAYSDKDGVLYSEDLTKSSDNGIFWRRIEAPETAKIIAAKDNYIIAETHRSSAKSGYFVSSDKGETWNENLLDYFLVDYHSNNYFFFDYEYIINDIPPKLIQKYENNKLEIFDITSNNTVIAEFIGDIENKEDNYGNNSLYTSNDFGVTWDYQFSYDNDLRGTFYTKSGYIYFNSTLDFYKGIKRNKTPFK